MNLNDFPRKNSTRGVHGPPGPHPQGFLTDWDSKWKQELLELGIKWVKILDTGDGSSLPLAEKLVGIDIMPIVRFYEEQRYPGLAKADREIKTAGDYVSIGVYYFETNNEPDLDLEWKDRKRPDNWLDIVVDNFIVEADMIRGVGGFLLFPAFGPGGRGNPFQMIVDRGRQDILDGNCGLAIHNYCLARPLDYPNDPVTLQGQPITKEEWENTATDKKDGNGAMWAWEMSHESVNEWRDRLKNPDATIMEDSTCFRAYEYFDTLINEACGHSIPIFTTEGGYNVGQRAGTTFGDDPRWPKPSPAMTAQMTLDMFNYPTPDYYFANCPWLIANYEMGYWQSYFEHQGPFYSRIFKYDWKNCEEELPVVNLLKENKMTNRRRPGIWGINGAGVNQSFIDKMYSWNPGMVTCFYDYIQANGVDKYKDTYPNVPVVIRFQHDKNWHENPSENAKNKANEIISKWPTIQHLDPYVYFCNEMNLHYENGDDNQNNQHLYTTPEFYEKYANWVTELADRIKQQVPEMKLVCPPFAYGHHEDGSPDDDGYITESFAGYDYLTNAIVNYFDNIICGHYYWGDHAGSNSNWLYGEDSKWHAFRWKKVLKLFNIRYGLDVRMIIDECGNFDVTDSDFTDQLIYYANETLKDNRIIGLTYFLFDDPTNSPGNMPNSWQRIPDLDSHLHKLKDMPDVGEIPPTEPPEEPEPPSQNVSMTIERGEGLHLIVGDWVKPNYNVTLFSPSGNYSVVVSGHKSEFGQGGFEFYAPEFGTHTLLVEDYRFEIPMSGQFTKLHFEYTDSQPAMFRLVSDLLPDDEAEEIWNNLESLYPGLFSIE